MNFIKDGFCMFGKHIDESVVSVADKDPSYLEWVLDRFDLDEDEISEIEAALKAL